MATEQTVERKPHVDAAGWITKIEGSKVYFTVNGCFDRDVCKVSSTFKTLQAGSAVCPIQCRTPDGVRDYTIGDGHAARIRLNVEAKLPESGGMLADPDSLPLIEL